MSSIRTVWGIGGRYGAGKDAVAEVLKRSGFEVVDVDRIGHELLEQGEIKRRVLERFGPHLLDDRGRIERRKLGREVFGSAGARRDLEAILHPPMIEEVRRRIEEASRPVAINAALLFPMGLDRYCSSILWVEAPFWTRLARVRRRDRLGLFRTLRRLLSQKAIAFKLKGPAVDIYYVRNRGRREDLQRRIEAILTEKGIATHG